MKQTGFKVSVVGWAMAALISGTGCNRLYQNDWDTVKQISYEEEAHLTDNASSPFCDFSIDFQYLKEDDDSIAAVINRTIQRELLGNDYASLVPETAVDSFKNVYIRNYRTDVGDAYREYLATADSEEMLPPWYSHSFELKTQISNGREGVLLVKADYFTYEGGAHPYNHSRWMNFDVHTGRLITKDEAFPAEIHREMEQELLEALLNRQWTESMDSLKASGFLLHTDMYIPDNFLLGKESTAFLFNPYDIAPYSEGSIVLEIASSRQP